MGERAEHPLSAANLVIDAVVVVTPAKRHAMGKAVISDPVTFGVSALGANASFRVGELLSDHEERRTHAFGAEHVEHVIGYLGFGPIVEAERDFHLVTFSRRFAWTTSAPVPRRTISPRAPCLFFLFHRGAAALERAGAALGHDYLRATLTADVNFS
jgi:hypothetical protein